MKGSVNQIHPTGSRSQTGTKKERGKRNPATQTKQPISKAEKGGAGQKTNEKSKEEGGNARGTAPSEWGPGDGPPGHKE